jgi:hypothetical protein
MPLDTSVGKINQGLKDLFLRWDDTKAVWKDPVSRSFEENHMVTLEKQLITTLKAMDRLAQELYRCKRECF